MATWGYKNPILRQTHTEFLGMFPGFLCNSFCSQGPRLGFEQKFGNPVDHFLASGAGHFGFAGWDRRRVLRPIACGLSLWTFLDGIIFRRDLKHSGRDYPVFRLERNHISIFRGVTGAEATFLASKGSIKRIATGSQSVDITAERWEVWHPWKKKVKSFGVIRRWAWNSLDQWHPMALLWCMVCQYGG